MSKKRKFDEYYEESVIVLDYTSYDFEKLVSNIKDPESLIEIIKTVNPQLDSSTNKERFVFVLKIIIVFILGIMGIQIRNFENENIKITVDESGKLKTIELLDKSYWSSFIDNFEHIL